MTTSLTLTFAELEFVLALRPRRRATLRGNLRLDGDGSGPSLVRAGLASLLARGLCEAVGATDEGERASLPDLRFDGELSALLTALSDDDGSSVMAAAWCGERGSVVHLVDGRGARMALFPERFGRFKAEVLDAREPVSAVLQRFLSRHLAEGTPSALVATSERDGRSAAVAIAIDAAGNWSASDSADSPDHAVPVTREQAMERVAALFDGRPFVAAQSDSR
ncbi:hypothetical protein KDK95_19705 [Actinospica sp. MGRD01-02]|uniref:Uncharacterized protein n=1 Tax=Actinospica acidithermotolerans TaxID=2828514 RepID=A0A941EDL6_9ACTN|nr:hypothetical protein [Actinospica acidithermotolerans]MBR7828547.1 hypothetical protein [Actinospica acidithermotolerans]